MSGRAALAGVCLGLCGCQAVPEYPPPEQRPVFTGFPLSATRIVNMDDPDAPLRFVRDISDELNANWRWTLASPAVRIRVRAGGNLRYTIDFTLPDVTFVKTGPLNIGFTVNGHVLDRVRYDSPGYKHFEKDVPADWVEPNQEAIVGAEVDKLWTSEDGTRYGMILSRIGLTN